MPPRNPPPNAMDGPGQNAGAGHSRDQENYYQDWKRNPNQNQEFNTINPGSKTPSEMQMLRPQRQQSEQEKRLVGLGYGRSSSINSGNLAQEALDQKYRMKDFSQEDPTGWVDPRAGKFSSVALQAQGHQLPPRPKPKIQPYPQGLSIIQDPAYMNNSM